MVGVNHRLIVHRRVNGGGYPGFDAEGCGWYIILGCSKIRTDARELLIDMGGPVVGGGIGGLTAAFDLARMGFPVTVIPNQGKGAATMRIEAVRRILPACQFNEKKTAPGLEALGWYHEKKDEDRDIGLGPEHDWSSHGADAFGLMAIAYEQHSQPNQDYGEWRPRKVV